jgi:hypothetical protein
MISRRTRLSLVQYLDRIAVQPLIFLLSKHELMSDRDGYGRSYTEYPDLTQVLPEVIIPANETRLASLLDEIARTQGYLYSNRSGNAVSYEERYADLKHCLLLDDYTLENKRFQAIDPSSQEAGSVEDELTSALRASGLPRTDDVVRRLTASTEGFRQPDPNLNAILNDARIALQTLATEIAKQRQALSPGKFDEEKWGHVLQYLRTSGFLDEREEDGLAGVFGFVSPGSHKPLDLSDRDMARLGRVLVHGMCWFLVKRYAASNPQPATASFI